jgi:hypothetical protein
LSHSRASEQRAPSIVLSRNPLMGCCCCQCRCCRPLSARAMDALWLSAVLWELLHDDRSALWAVRVPGTELELGGRGARGR